MGEHICEIGTFHDAHACSETHACAKSECLTHETHILRLSPSCEHVGHDTFMVPRYK